MGKRRHYREGSKVCRVLALHVSSPGYRRLRSATDAKMLPQPEPRAMREHFVMPSIGSRDVACAEWPNIRRFEHFLYLRNLVDDAFNVHASQYLTERHTFRH